MAGMRVLITGSRDWADAYAIGMAYDWIYESITGNPYDIPSPEKKRDVIIVSGRCPSGADFLCERRAFDYGFTVEPHPADWKTHGRGAGLIRNQEMVDSGADICFGFINPCRKPNCSVKRTHLSHGAMDCTGKAGAAGIPTYSWIHMNGQDVFPTLPVVTK